MAGIPDTRAPHEPSAEYLREDLNARGDLALDSRQRGGWRPSPGCCCRIYFPILPICVTRMGQAVLYPSGPHTREDLAMHSLRLRQLAELSGREWLWLLQSLTLLPLAWVSIRLCGWQRTMTNFRRIAGAVPPAPRTLDPGQSVDVARMVRVAATFGPARVSCLPRAVVLWTLLRRKGHDAVVCLGVRKGVRGPDAHAWVEVSGLSLDDPTNEPFRTFSAASFTATL